jgi:predicted DNA-binding antitoxin AbrB/MazE fold protein
MSTPIRGKYENGAIHPTNPLDLPEGTDLSIQITVVGKGRVARPHAPRISAEELQTRIHSHAVAVGSLPAEFSRSDIYQDHD